uniref:Nuclear Testis protein N-terminal domain-containing protein n=1 Tax=Gopherus agassizii TaxID=38772 RepID=A0A452GL16_9SAUR
LTTRASPALPRNSPTPDPQPPVSPDLGSPTALPGPPPPRQVPPLPPLLLPAFPGAALLLTSPDIPGGKLIVKLKPEGAQELPQAQTIILTGAPVGWSPPRQDGAPIRLQLAAGIRTVLLSKAGEEPGPRETPPAQAPPTSDPSASCTSKGVYENYRRWQRYKALARRHFPGTPDAEALACFFIPVLRSLTRLRPEMALEEGVPRAVQEWERSSNFERMIFYEMAEKFMEFEAEEELQIQKMKEGCASPKSLAPSAPSHFPLPDAPPQNLCPIQSPHSLSPNRPLPGPPAPNHPSRTPLPIQPCLLTPRRRQRRLSGPLAPREPREIPPEAVRQYAEIMEGLRPSWEEKAGEASGRGEPQSQAQGALPDPTLLQYVEQLCEDESFICKVEAVIHPQFLAQLLSPEKRRDPLDLSEELEQELGLTPSQLVEKRLLALSEEELSLPLCPAPHLDSTPSQSEEEDEGSSQKGLASHRQAMSGASPPRGSRVKGGALGTETPETPTPTPVQPSHNSPSPGAIPLPDLWGNSPLWPLGQFPSPPPTLAIPHPRAPMQFPPSPKAIPLPSPLLGHSPPQPSPTPSLSSGASGWGSPSQWASSWHPRVPAPPSGRGPPATHLQGDPHVGGREVRDTGDTALPPRQHCPICPFPTAYPFSSAPLANPPLSSPTSQPPHTSSSLPLSPSSSPDPPQRPFQLPEPGLQRHPQAPDRPHRQGAHQLALGGWDAQRPAGRQEQGVVRLRGPPNAEPPIVSP